MRNHQKVLEVHCESVKKHNEDMSTHITSRCICELPRYDEFKLRVIIGEQREKVLNWIDPNRVDPETNHRAARKLCQPGTGQWFMESDEYSRWLATNNSLLWLYAIRKYRLTHTLQFMRNMGLTWNHSRGWENYPNVCTVLLHGDLIHIIDNLLDLQ